MADKNRAASKHQLYCRVDENCYRDFQFVGCRNSLTIIDNKVCLFVCLFVCLCCFYCFVSTIHNSYDKDYKKSFLAFDVQLFDVSR